MSPLHTKPGVHRAIAVTAFVVYLVIACGANLFHTEECPLTTGKTAPSSDSCPACKFLAGANSTEVSPDSCPVTFAYQIALLPAPSAQPITSRHWASSIILRGPPSPTLA